MNVRSLVAADLDAVTALDRRITGSSSRAGYFEKRLDSAIRHPHRHLQLGAFGPDGPIGLLLGRVLDGEYGRKGSAVVLETVGVDPKSQHTGIARKMLDALEHKMLAHDIREIVTQADWRTHSMLRFLDGARFSVAPRQILERRVHRMPLPETDEEIEKAPPVVRHLRATDTVMISRIDHLLTGEDRTPYLSRKVDEALTDSAIRVSLVAEEDGFVVAFAMAHVDYGDFGHVEPTAELHTMGVHPGFAHKGFARAILTQMIDNLSALHVESLETEISRENFDLLRFLYRFGFGPSQSLAFHRRLNQA